MYAHILIATDGSELAAKGLDHGLALAKALGSMVTIVTVTETWDVFELAKQIEHHPERNPLNDFASTAAAVATSILQAATAAAAKVGVFRRDSACDERASGTRYYQGWRRERMQPYRYGLPWAKGARTARPR